MTTAFQRRTILSAPTVRGVVPVAGIAGRFAVDVSNFTGPLSQATLQAWKQIDVGLVIVQAVDPPPGYPPSQTWQQIQACVAAGLTVDVYLYLWATSNVELDMRVKLALLNGLEQSVRKLWLDVEDTTQTTTTARVTAVRQALAVLDGWSAAHGKLRPGIYTGPWYWNGYMDGTTEFSDRTLWDSQYDHVANIAVGWASYGGWQRRTIKQYVGSSSLAGQSGIDLSVLSDEERRQG